MAFLSVPNVVIRGIATCVPPKIDENINYDLPQEEIQKFIENVGVERKHIVESNVCTSDLCYKAADVLINNLGWERDEINFLIFVSQTPDYITPATSCILQDRLSLNKECYTLDISLGCSGWVYGLSVISTLVSNNKGKGLLLVGDTISKFTSKEDKSAWMLFGDAGSATAIEYEEGNDGFKMHLASDGEGYEAIIIPDGGYRNTTTKESLVSEKISEGITRNKLQLILDGMSVFTFGISQAPKSVNKLLEYFNIDKEKIDYYIFHQANMLMNEKIRKKLKLEQEKVPYSLKDFGNTSCTTIPLTMNANIGDKLNNNSLEIIACAFGVGLSWGTVYFKTDKFLSLPLIEY